METAENHHQQRQKTPKQKLKPACLPLPAPTQPNYTPTAENCTQTPAPAGNRQHQSATQTKPRVPTPFIVQTSLYIQSRQTPLPRQHFYVIHQFQNLKSLIIKNHIVPRLPNHPHYRVPNQPLPLRSFFELTSLDQPMA